MSSHPQILIASDAGVSIISPADINDAVGACWGADARALVLTEGDVGPAFFDLRSGLAGETFQKLVNYRIRLAIVLPDPGAHGDRVRELAHEHATSDHVRFVSSRADALNWLTRALS